jgi:hypothetical protein
MPYQTYDIIFSGQLLEGSDLETTRQQVGKLFKASAEQLDRLFSGKPVIIKSGADDDSATKYRMAFKQAGALVEIRLSDTPSSETAPVTQPTEEDMTLLPPNTGSLIDCAKPVTPQPIPDIDYISLAEPGATIDEHPAPEPVDIDTGDLSMTPPNSGTLEDCKKEVEPYPIPDIGYMDIDKK